MVVPTLDLRDPRTQTDRYGLIEEVRAQNSYARTPDGAVVFLNQAEVIEVLACKDFRFTFNLIDDSKSPYLAKAIQHELLNMHGQAHGRLSRLVKIALRDRVLEGMQAQVDEIVDLLVSELPAQTEFCADFADPLPARILGPMFGVPYQDTEGLNEWIQIGGRKVDALQSGVDIERVEDANRKIHDFLRDLLAERRRNLGDDLFSELIQAEIGGDRMNDDELVYLAAELASAGVDTTRTQLPLILLALLEHPDQMAKLRDDPKLALRAVDEGMRFAPLPWALPHAAVHDGTFNGIEFKQGDLAFVLVPAANRDPSVVETPNVFDITRSRVRNFAFGGGMHACPGAQLARMEMASALRVLVERCRSITLAKPPEWEEGNVGRTLKRLHLEIHN